VNIGLHASAAIEAGADSRAVPADRGGLAIDLQIFRCDSHFFVEIRPAIGWNTRRCRSARQRRASDGFQDDSRRAQSRIREAHRSAPASVFGRSCPSLETVLFTLRG
jgi:hypothetical protein